MVELKLFAKRNSDGSYSTAIAAGDLIKYAFVDFYKEGSGEGEGKGYQRKETQRETRGRQIEAYIRLCTQKGIKPSLFEMTANARSEEPDREKFGLLYKNSELGTLKIRASSDEPFLSLIDGGTRFLGIERALKNGLVQPEDRFDMRVFIGLPKGKEIGYFLLINDKHKKVRTDLGLRVTQRNLDAGKLSSEEKDFLAAVVPEDEQWKYDASRIASKLNGDAKSKWHNRIQMPSQGKKCIALQAFFTSLKPLLTDKDLNGYLDNTLADQRLLKWEVLLSFLNNFWDAVSQLNPDAYREPETSVLWGPIGVSSHHIALTKILVSELRNGENDFTSGRFKKMMSGSTTEDYEYWFTKSGSLKNKNKYPGDKGDATKMTGVANYSRVAKTLEDQWRKTLSSANTAPRKLIF